MQARVAGERCTDERRTPAIAGSSARHIATIASPSTMTEVAIPDFPRE